MQSHVTKRVVELPEAEYQKLHNEIKDLSKLIQLALKSSNSGVEKIWISRVEFMKVTNIGATFFNDLRNSNKLRLKRVGRKVFVHTQCIQDYFDNKL